MNGCFLLFLKANIDNYRNKDYLIFETENDISRTRGYRISIEDFIGFVRTRMNDAARFTKAEGSIRRYADAQIKTLFGGRRSRSKRSDKKRTTKKRLTKRLRKTVKRRKNKTIKKRR